MIARDMQYFMALKSGNLAQLITLSPQDQKLVGSNPTILFNI